MKRGSFVFLPLLGIMLLWPVYAQQPAPEGSLSANTEKFISWAWDFPSEIEAQYPITQYSHWRNIATPIGGGFRFLHYRTEENQDDYHCSGYGFFRPVVLNFSHGVLLSVGGFVGFNSFLSEFDYNLNALNPKNKTVREGIPMAVGFSMMLSLPEHGIQMCFEAGHAWRRIKAKVEDVVVAPGLPTGYIQRNQKDSGITLYYEISAVSERTWMNGITLNVMATYITGPTELDVKLVHPLLGTISQTASPECGSFVVGNAYIKVAALPVPQFSDLLPPKPLITVEPGFAVSHFASDDGHGLSAGVRVSVFDAVRFFYFHNWEQMTEEPNSDIFAVEVGFNVGRSSSSSKL
jgi:hypothetical protein